MPHPGRRVARMCSSNSSVKQMFYERHAAVISDCRSPFRSGHMLAICARLRNKGKRGAVGRNRRCLPFPSPWVWRSAPAERTPAEVQRKSPARQGRTRLRQFVRPLSRCRKRSRPLGANTLTQFVCSGNSVQKKEPRLAASPKREDKFDFNLLRYPTESPS